MKVFNQVSGGASNNLTAARLNSGEVVDTLGLNGPGDGLGSRYYIRTPEEYGPVGPRDVVIANGNIAVFQLFIANYLLVQGHSYEGDNTYKGQSDFEGVTNVQPPTQDSQAATKKYVDDTTTEGTQPGDGLVRDGAALNVGQGTGIVVNPDDVAFDQDYGDNRYMQPPEDLLERSVIINEDKFPAQDTDGNRFSIQWGNAIANLADPLRARGAWDAESNIVTLDPLNTTLAKGQPPESDGADPVGWFYIVNKPGLFDLTDDPGPESWQLNDKALWLETGWARIPGPAGGSGTVETVFGRPGPDILAEDEDYSDALITNTSKVVGSRVSDALDTLYESLPVMTAADFFALAEKRIRDNIGSGVLEWGGSIQSSLFDTITEGMYVRAHANLNTNWINRIGLGRGTDRTGGVSRTDEPIFNVNGIALVLRGINANPSTVLNDIRFPPAPDGLDKADGTGRFADLNEAISAGGTELSESVINRQDFCFLEVWHEKVSDKDIVVPLGNVQYGTTEWNGITLVGLNTIGVAQGYSAFGEWDTDTQGNGVQWSTLSDEDKLTFIQDPENNIYIEDGELIQVRYRIRTIAGLEGDWEGVNPRSDLATIMCHEIGVSNVISQGQQDISEDWRIGGSGGIAVFYSQSHSSGLSPDVGAYGAGLANVRVPELAHNGLCFAVPICMVSRHNQGAYDPVYNSRGCRRHNATETFSTGRHWYEPAAIDFSSISDAFNILDATQDTTTAGAAQNTGSISTGTSGRDDGQYYDAIYAAYVQDLRVRADEKPEDEIREMYHRKAIANEMRGWEKVPFSKASPITNYTSAEPDRFVIDSVPTQSYAELGNNESIFLTPYLKMYATNRVDGEIKDFTVTRVRFRTGSPIGAAYDIYYLEADSRHIGIDVTNWDFMWVELREIRAQEHTWTDISGPPDLIAQVFPNGVYAQWIPVASGDIVDVPLNRKFENGETADSVWRQYTFIDTLGDWISFGREVDLTRNEVNLAIDDYVQLVHYTTSAHFTEDWDNSEVVSLGEPSSTVRPESNRGSILASSLIGKVTTSTLGKHTTNVPLVHYALQSHAGNKLATTEVVVPEHIALALDRNNDSPAYKTLDYLSSTNGKYDLVMAYKEMIYKIVGSIEVLDQKSVTLSHGQVGKFTQPGSLLGQAIKSTGGAVSGLDMSNWGVTSDGTVLDQNDNPRSDFVSWDGSWWNDNNQFEITDGQSTLVNDAGDTVLYGTARLQDHIVQYFRPQHKEAGPEVTATVEVQPVDDADPEDGIKPVEES